MHKKIFLFIIIVLFLVCCNKNNKENNTNVESLTEVEFEKPIVDFGKVSCDTLLIAEFNFINKGKNNLKIEYVNPDCTCTDYKLSSDVIAPEECGKIQLFFDTRNKVGSQKVYAIVKANTEERFYRLLMQADIEL